MNYKEYKGHVIYPTPRLVVETGDWKIQLTVRYKEQFKILTYDTQFSSKGEAVEHCINYGKRLIDEGIDI